MPALIVLDDRVRPSILWYNSYLHALFRAVRSRSRTKTVPLVYWYCCTPSILHSSCCTTAYATVYCGTNPHLRALLRDVRSRSRTGTVLFSMLDLLHSIVPALLVLYDRVRPNTLWYELIPACAPSCCTISYTVGYCCTNAYTCDPFHVCRPAALLVRPLDFAVRPRTRRYNVRSRTGTVLSV